MAGEPGPWVSPEKFELIERFKFFHELAWKRVSRGKRFLQQLARYRCDQDNYRWPVTRCCSPVGLVPVQKIVMMALKHILLINPTITSRRSARFPLAVLNLSASLDGSYASSIIDGNIDRDFVATTLRRLARGAIDAVGISVMGGPQLRSAIRVSREIRARFPSVPIIWGGHFPSICAEPALNTPYLDYAIRGQGEETLRQVLDAVFNGGELAAIAGLSWRSGGQVVHNKSRAFSAASLTRTLPYERAGDPRNYLARTFLGRRTTGYQAALGCRFRCTFCGVASMFRGKTALPAADRLDQDLRYLTTRLGVDAVQFFDHNFFDREQDTAPLLEVLAKYQLPWWCFARSDALINLSEQSWALVRKSRLRMAYIGAECCPATGCCTTCARAPARIRRWRRLRSAAVTA